MPLTSDSRTLLELNSKKRVKHLKQCSVYLYGAFLLL